MKRSSHRKWHSSVTKLQKAGLQSDINVTPFVDVCLVLLIIFMVVTPMLQKGVPVVLPKTVAPEKTPDTQTQLQVSVKDDGIIYLGPNIIRDEDLEAQLKDIHERTPDREIAVKGDKNVNYGRVLRVLKACRDVGFEDVGLIAEPIKQTGAET
ncbi:MAG: biopolymer transporter ExbD [Thermoanaerobaculia bacterium]